MSYQKIIVNDTVTLSWILPYTGGITVATFNDLDTRGALPEAILLPPTNVVNLGSSITFTNVGEIYCILNDSNNNLITNLAVGTTITMYTIGTSGLATDWRVVPYGGGVGGIMNLTAQNADGSIVITDGGGVSNPTIISSVGTLNFKSNLSITNLLALKTNSLSGIMVASSVDPTQVRYTTRSLIAGSNILISNPDGIADNPQVGLATVLTNIQEIDIGSSVFKDGSISSPNGFTINGLGIDTTGNLTTSTLTTNTLVTSAINGPLLDPLITLNGVTTIDEQGNIVAPIITANTINVQTLNVSGNTRNSQAATAWCTFQDTGTGCTASILVLNQFNIATVTASGPGTYTLAFSDSSFVTNHFAVVATLMHSGASLTPFMVFVKEKTNTTFTITCIDTLGNLLPPTEGVGIIVFANYA